MPIDVFQEVFSNSAPAVRAEIDRLIAAIEQKFAGKANPANSENHEVLKS